MGGTISDVLGIATSGLRTAQSMVTTAEALDSADHFFNTLHLRPATVIGQELACATHTSMASAMTHIRLTQQVAERMPKSWVALDRGEWSLTHLRALAHATEHCPPRVAQQVEDRIVADAIRRGWTPAQVKKHALRVIAAIDPDARRMFQRETRNSRCDVAN